MYRQQFYILTNILMLIDGLLCIFSGYSAYMLSIEYGSDTLIMGWNDVLVFILGVMFVNNFAMARFSFYSEKRFQSYIVILRKLFTVCALTLLITTAIANIIGIKPISRMFVVYYFVILLFLVIIVRIIQYFYLDRRAATSFNSRQILLVGSKIRLKPVITALTLQRSWGHQVVGYLGVDEKDESSCLDTPYLGEINIFDEILIEKNIDEVIFSLPSDYPVDLKSYINKCSNIGVNFRIVPGMFKDRHQSFHVENLLGIPMLASYSWNANASGLFYKRVLDIVMGFTGVIVFLILFPFIAIAIKIESPGPVLFRQKRIGMHGREFFIYKFRSMVADAENKKKDLMTKTDVPWPIYKAEKDPRVTKIGNFLRKTSLDELPQFINVVFGQMSLVGTRPPTPDEVDNYEDWHRKRISIKPGITGLWQISGRKKIKDFTEVVRLDLKYIDGWKFWRDLEIIWKTFSVVLRRKGAE